MTASESMELLKENKFIWLETGESYKREIIA